MGGAFGCAGRRMARRTDICVDDFRMDRPHANPSPLGAINPLRFGNSSGKSLVRDLRNKQEQGGHVAALLFYLETKNFRYAIAARVEVHDVRTSRNLRSWAVYRSGTYCVMRAYRISYRRFLVLCRKSLTAFYCLRPKTSIRNAGLCLGAPVMKVCSLTSGTWRR